MCKEKKCTNCKFFKSYEEYYLCDCIGFCTSYDVPHEKARIHIIKNICCDCWEAGQNNRKAERIHIENVLIDMQEKLAQIAQILKEEEN